MIKKTKLTVAVTSLTSDKSYYVEIHRYNIPKLIKKAIQELQGISTVLIYDGKVENSEIEVLKSWLYKNDEYLVGYPLEDLKKLFREITEDGNISVDERTTLLKFLSSIAASSESNPVVDEIFVNNPKIIFNSKKFLFTGNLIYGSRAKAQSRVIELGGKCLVRLTMDTDYLIVGSLGSEDYKYSRFGTKIESAITYNREKGANIAIIKEKDFVNAIIKS